MVSRHLCSVYVKRSHQPSFWCSVTRGNKRRRSLSVNLAANLPTTEPVIMGGPAAGNPRPKPNTPTTQPDQTRPRLPPTPPSHQAFPPPPSTVGG
ncbi:hypothetical protein E2C01_078293 [Portunus trituberculatus]|uniref:Uncharacterized protein n=1 Tax=Portunus trituberculatus TaxID=210409 RepID=A0A5B7IDX4_PORTR|nr:hypothetical protein [Portunus trituberculatus]